MGLSGYVLSGTVAFVVFATFAWRLASRRHSVRCPAWLGWMVELDNPFTSTNRAAVILEQLDLEPGMSLLDAGCGPGRLGVPAAGQVTALDIQEKMLRRVREKAEAANPNNIRFLHAGLGEGRLEKNAFSRALLVTVLGEIPDQDAAMKEIFEALKPRGGCFQ